MKEVLLLYKPDNLPRFRSVKKSEALSRFFPGSGQVYSGRVTEGGINFLLNAGLLGFSLFEFYSGYYFTGYIVGLTIFNKTYHGGIHRAGEMAEAKNREMENRFNSQNSELMLKLNIYTGPNDLQESGF